MLSYIKWKESKKALNESFGPAITLGVRSPDTIGVVGVQSIEQTLEEAKKKLKKMDGDVEEPVEEKPEPEDKPEPEEKPEPDKEDKPEPEDKPEDKPEEPEAEDKPTLFQKKQSKKMTKEDYEFWQSLHRQLHGGLPGEKFWDGISEEALIPPTDPNKDLAAVEEPQAQDNQ